MKQEIIDLYDEFTHRGLDRRVFMARLAELAGGTAAAATACLPRMPTIPHMDMPHQLISMRIAISREPANAKSR